jgi:hypothetical protein
MKQLLGLLGSLVLLVLLPTPAWADSDSEVTPGDDDFNVEVEVTDVGTIGEVEQSSSQSTEPAAFVVDPCGIPALQPLLDPVDACDEATADAPEVTPGMVAAALQVIPLPPSELQVQPANGRTLVNFATNFYTDTAPFDRTVTLLGQRVDLHIVPSGFGWRFGDGRTLETADAGAPYPDLRVTHTYQRKGDVAPAVDTTYTATYRVNDGPWADVPGSVTVAGVPVGLEVLTATPVLVGY